MTNQHPKAILFDWDGTLAETRSAVVKAMEYTLALYHKEPWNITKQKYRDTTKSLKENFPNFFGNDYKQAYATYLNYYQQNAIKQIYPILNAEKFLNQCTQNNIEIYVISNKEKSLLLQEVKQCFPQITFKNILGNGDSLKNKPAPDPVFTALASASYPINKNTVWLIGDSKQDTACALSANILPILIGIGKFMEKAEVSEQIANNKIIQIQDFNQLIGMLK